MLKPVVESARLWCEREIVKAVEKKFGTKEKINVEMHFNPDRKADASCAIAFQLAAKLKKNPSLIAVEIAENITPRDLIASVSSLNGFVNFDFSSQYHEKALAEAGEEHFGKSARKKDAVIVEYSSPNVGKPMHIGHIRSTIFGHALKVLLECSGRKVIGFNYLGDAGSQVAKLMLALERYSDLPEIKTERDLLAYYVRINEEVERSETLKKRERELLEAIESGDEKVASALEKVRGLSLKAFNETYKTLGVEFDEIIGESAFVQDAKKIVNEALEKKAAFRDKGGEVVAQLEPQVPNLILMRSNGTTLYSTRDLALADYKFKKYKFSESIYVTASEQNLHFRQVFAILSKLGREYNNRHVGFGLINFEGEKMSTRSGKVILLADVIEEAKQEAKQQILQRDATVAGQELKERALAIGLSALKFAVLRVSGEKDINFDFKRMVSFEGDTGPYLQYSLVRCKSILNKAAEKTKENTKKNKKYNFNHEEKELVISLSAFPIIIEKAGKSLSPHILCDYLLKTAAAFSKFYSMHSVLDAEMPEAKITRLKLVKATANVLETGLELLGITPLKKM